MRKIFIVFEFFYMVFAKNAKIAKYSKIAKNTKIANYSKIAKYSKKKRYACGEPKFGEINFDRGKIAFSEIMLGKIAVLGKIALFPN